MSCSVTSGVRASLAACAVKVSWSLARMMSDGFWAYTRLSRTVVSASVHGSSAA